MSTITEKIRKLLALSTSSNIHEAALAARRAADLMAKHNITLTQVEIRAHTANHINNEPYTGDLRRHDWAPSRPRRHDPD